MLFNSVEFILFFLVVFFVYHIPLKGKTKAQNVLLLAASYFFYGYANWKMLPLLVITTIVFYFLGQGIAKAKTERMNSFLSTLGIVLGVGILLYFKYLNFFIESAAHLLEGMGMNANIHTLNLIMPLGISFFTFRLISYVVEIHRETIEPSKDIVVFATYVSFFPCILSGPIDRPKFMKQLEKERVFDYDVAVDGLRQILWGLFKKMVVADNCAHYVDMAWGDIAGNSGSTLLLAAVLYLMQVYADFSGYSDMAIGIGKLLGFKIADNFKFPLFALNIADFWRRWHISLTTWMTDYVFMPLNLRFRGMGKWGMILAIVINMFLVGIWHGANWTYAVYGLYHGLLFVPLVLTGAFARKEKLKTNRIGLPCLKDFGRIMLTWLLVVVGLIIFRGNCILEVFDYFQGVVQLDLLSVPCLMTKDYYIPLFVSIGLMLVVEWIQKDKQHGMDLSNIYKAWVRYVIYFVIITIVFWLGGHAEEYVYFQF